jgi:hypothetical protein
MAALAGPVAASGATAVLPPGAVLGRAGAMGRH